MKQITKALWSKYVQSLQLNRNFNMGLSHDVASGSDRKLCNEIDKRLVVYRFIGNVMTSIITLRK